MPQLPGRLQVDGVGADAADGDHLQARQLRSTSPGHLTAPRLLIRQTASPARRTFSSARGRPVGVEDDLAVALQPFEVRRALQLRRVVAGDHDHHALAHRSSVHATLHGRLSPIRVIPRRTHDRTRRERAAAGHAPGSAQWYARAQRRSPAAWATTSVRALAGPTCIATGRGRTSGTWTATATSTTASGNAPSCWATPTRRRGRGPDAVGRGTHFGNDHPARSVGRGGPAAGPVRRAGRASSTPAARQACWPCAWPAPSPGGGKLAALRGPLPRLARRPRHRLRRPSTCRDPRRRAGEVLGPSRDPGQRPGRGRTRCSAPATSRR